MPDKPPTALVLYHFLYPDEVVSSVLFSELCAGLASRGWRVTASACNREWGHEDRKHPLRSSRNGVEFRRVWRPRFRQSSGLGRIVNAVWMIAAWSLMALDWRLHADVVVIGTDPILSPTVALAWKFFRPRVKVAHWCFDLYPEAAISAGLLREGSLLVRTLKRLLRWSYGRCALVVDIGACMRGRLDRYASAARKDTITPWALVEPERPAPVDPIERQALFGQASIGLLYSGSFGLAHSWKGIPELAKALASHGGKIVFSVQGNAAAELRSAMEKAEAPVGFAAFASTRSLENRLSSADVHIVSLSESWTGTVVPSKFFGALAIGRPVLFLGSPDSAIARWIEEYRVGWVLTAGNLDTVADELVRQLGGKAGERLFAHCHAVYRANFSKQRAVERWNSVLCDLKSTILS